MADNDGVNIPIESSADTSGFDQIAAAGVALGERLKELQAQEAATAQPVTPTVKVDGAPKAAADLKEVGEAGKKAGEDVEEGMSEADKFIEKITEDVGTLGGAFKAGLGIGTAQVLIEGLEEAVGRLREFAAEGVEVNKEFESLQISLASSLRQANAGEYSSFNAALVTSGQLIDIVKQKALELNLNAQDLGHNLQVNMLALVEGGITDLNKEVETTGLLMQAAAAKGVTGFQAVRDVIDILQGRAERVILSRELGITNDDIAQAKKAGDLADYLAGKLGAYREAAAATRETLAGLQQQEANLGQNLLQNLGAQAFENAKEQARGIVEAFKSDDLQTASYIFQEMLGEITSIAGQTGSFAQFLAAAATSAATVLNPIGAYAGFLNQATAASNALGTSFEQRLEALQKEILAADTIGKVTTARSDIENLITATMVKRAGASQEDKDLLDQQLTLLQHMLSTLDTTAGKSSDLQKFDAARVDSLKQQQDLLDGQNKRIEQIDKTLAQRDTQDLKKLNPEELKSRLNAQLQNAQDLLAQGGISFDADADPKLDADSIVRYRNQLVAASDTKEAQDQLQELKVKLSETALDVSNLGKAYEEASKKSDAAAEKEEKAGQKQTQAVRDFMRELGDEKDARDELTKSQAALAAAESAGDKDSEAGKKRIKDAVADLQKTTEALAAAEAKRHDAQQKAYPEELAQIAKLQQALKEIETTGEQAEADQRADLQNQIRALQDQVSGKAPAPTLSDDAKARILGDIDPSTGKPNPDAVPQDFRDKPPGYADAGPEDATTGPALDQSGDSLGQAAASLGQAAGTLQQNAGQTAQQASQVQQALTTAQQSDTNYHDAVMQGFLGVSSNVDGLTQALLAQNQTIANQGQAIAQLQLQVGNLANDSD